jgi:hypothetical protein
MDLYEPLGGFMRVLEDYCDLDYRDGGGLLTEKEIFILTINFLNIADNESEAIEAMSIQVNTFCKYLPTPYNKQRIYAAIVHYIRQMHRLFKESGLYGADSYLGYTFGGWHMPLVPLLIPYTHLRHYPDAVSAIVGGEPVDPRPSRVFHPYNNIRDPYYSGWPLTPRPTDVLPY